MLWTARRHLLAVARTALGIGTPLDDSEEPIGYRLCFCGLLATLTGMVVWYGTSA